MMDGNSNILVAAGTSIIHEAFLPSTFGFFNKMLMVISDLFANTAPFNCIEEFF